MKALVTLERFVGINDFGGALEVGSKVYEIYGSSIEDLVRVAKDELSIMFPDEAFEIETSVSESALHENQQAVEYGEELESELSAERIASETTQGFYWSGGED